MNVLHVVPGLNEPNNGIAVAAKLIAGERGAVLVDCSDCSTGRLRAGDYDEVWVHSMWLPQTMLACWRAIRAGKRLVRMTHANLDPVRLGYHGWRKRMVAPIERWLLRRCVRIVATCEAEREWIRAYVGRGCPEIVVEDLKRFFKIGSRSSFLTSGKDSAFPLRLLYLGRRHPLKGVEYLERAVAELAEAEVRAVELRIVSDHFGDELEGDWAWCDVLVLPTLSENFGLVVAEALERGKRVITTDGAPVWRQEGMTDGGRLIYLRRFRDGTDVERVGLLKEAICSLV